MEKEVVTPLCRGQEEAVLQWVRLTLSPCESVLLEDKKGIWLGSLSVSQPCMDATLQGQTRRLCFMLVLNGGVDRQSTFAKASEEARTIQREC